MGAKLQKITLSVKFFPKKFAGFKKTPYLCTRKSEMTSLAKQNNCKGKSH